MPNNNDQTSSIYITDPEEFIDASNIGQAALVGTAQGATQAQTALGSTLQTFGFGGQAQGNIVSIVQESPEALAFASQAAALSAQTAQEGLEAAQAAGIGLTALAKDAMDKAQSLASRVSSSPFQSLVPVLIVGLIGFFGYKAMRGRA